MSALARAACLSPAHFSREFRRAFGETPHQYLLTRRLERAAAMLRNTDRSVADICFTVGLRSVGSFTTSFGRVYGVSPTAYRAAHPPAADRARIPTCVLQAYARPRSSRFGEDTTRPRTNVGVDGSTHEGDTMLKQLTHVQGWVHDQDEALAFYTEKLGMELREDITVPEMGNFRWLTVGAVGQQDVSMMLMAIPGPPVFDEETRDADPEAAGQGRQRRPLLPDGRLPVDLRGAEGPRCRVHAGADRAARTASTPGFAIRQATRSGCCRRRNGTAPGDAVWGPGDRPHTRGRAHRRTTPRWPQGLHGSRPW